MEKHPEIPDYQILRELGRGGMSRVYLALQLTLQREVALKVMSGHLDDQGIMRKRFIYEARTLARLSHRNIVSVIDIRDTDTATYMSMEHLSGGTLTERAAQGLSVAEVVSIIAQTASALQYAHDHGIVHRDMKPENILFRANGTPVLTDFGIAKERDAKHASMTQTGMFIGTPNYMSPEQIQGKELDGRADQYGLGVVLYELLCGRKPFVADSATAVLLMHVTDKPPPLPGEFADFQPIIDRMLAKNPAERYPSCTDFIRVLRRTVTASKVLWPKLQSTPNTTLSEQLRALGFSGTHTLSGQDPMAAGSIRQSQPTGEVTVIRAAPEDEAPSATVFRPTTHQQPAVDSEAALARLADLLAQPELDPRTVSLIAAELRPQLEHGSGALVQTSLVQRLQSLAAGAGTPEDLDRVRQMLAAASANLGTTTDFSTTEAAIKARQDQFDAASHKATLTASHMAAARIAIRQHKLLPPDPDNAFDCLTQARSTDPDHTEAGRLLDNLPKAIIAVAEAHGQRGEFKAARALIQHGIACYPNNASLSELLKSITARLRDDLEHKVYIKRVDELTRQARDNLADAIPSILDFLDKQKPSSNDPTLRPLWQALKNWSDTLLSTENLAVLDAAPALLKRGTPHMAHAPELESAWREAETHVEKQLASIRQHQVEAARLKALERTVADTSLFFSLQADGLVSCLREAIAEGLEGSASTFLLREAARMGDTVQKAAHSDTDGAIDFTQWLRELAKVPFAQPLAKRWQSIVKAERKQRDVLEQLTTLANEPLHDTPILQKALQALTALIESDPTRPTFSAVVHVFEKALARDLGACTESARLAELEAVCACLVEASARLGEEAKTTLQRVDAHLVQAREQVARNAAHTRLTNATTLFEQSSSRKNLKLAIEHLAKIDSKDDNLAPVIAHLKELFEARLGLELQEGRWSTLETWLETGRALLDEAMLEQWQVQRDQARDIELAASAKRDGLVTEYRQRLEATGNTPLALANLVSELQRVAPDTDAPISAYATQLAEHVLATIKNADDTDIAVLEAIVTLWERQRIGGVGAEDLRAALNARLSSSEKENLIKHHQLRLVDALTAGDLNPSAAGELLAGIGGETPAPDAGQWQRIIVAWAERSTRALDANAIVEAREWLKLLCAPQLPNQPTAIVNELAARIDDAEQNARAPGSETHAAADEAQVSIPETDKAAATQQDATPEEPAPYDAPTIMRPSPRRSTTPPPPGADDEDALAPTLMVRRPPPRPVADDDEEYSPTVPAYLNRLRGTVGTRPSTPPRSAIPNPAPDSAITSTRAQPKPQSSPVDTPVAPGLRGHANQLMALAKGLPRAAQFGLGAALLMLVLIMLWPRSNTQITAPIASAELARVDTALIQAETSSTIEARIRALVEAHTTDPTVLGNKGINSRRTRQEEQILEDIQRLSFTDPPKALKLVELAQPAFTGDNRFSRIAASVRNASPDSEKR